jgi:hypothetical protein
MRGKNFDPNKLGTSCENLQATIKKCSVSGMTDHLFQTTPNDCHYEWYVKFHFVLGKDKCVERTLD